MRKGTICWKQTYMTDKNGVVSVRAREERSGNSVAHGGGNVVDRMVQVRACDIVGGRLSESAWRRSQRCLRLCSSLIHHAYWRPT